MSGSYSVCHTRKVFISLTQLRCKKKLRNSIGPKIGEKNAFKLCRISSPRRLHPCEARGGGGGGRGDAVGRKGDMRRKRRRRRGKGQKCTQKPFPLLKFAPFPSTSSIEGKLYRWRNCIGASQLLLSSPLLAKNYPPCQPALL